MYNIYFVIFHLLNIKPMHFNVEIIFDLRRGGGRDAVMRNINMYTVHNVCSAPFTVQTTS